jgi:hypothetical protein
MKVLYSLFLVLVVCAAATIALEKSASIPSHVERSAYAGRSGQLQAAWPSDLISVSDASKSRAYVSAVSSERGLAAQQRVDDTQFADLFSHLLGVPTPSSAGAEAALDRSWYPSSSLFEKPSAALLVSLDGVSHELVNAAGNSLAFAQGVELVLEPSCVHGGHGAESLAELQTLLTASVPAAHGVVGTRWASASLGGAAVDAFVDEHVAHAQRQTASVADVMAASQRRSLIVSVGGSAQTAAALGVHPSVGGGQLLSVHWDARTNKLVTRGSRVDALPLASLALPAFAFDERSPLYALLASSAGIAVEPRAAARTLAVTMTSSARRQVEMAEFDLARDADRQLFGELHALAATLELVAAQPALRALAADGRADLFSVGFTALRAFAVEARSRHAPAAATLRLQVALRIVDAAISEATRRLSSVYGEGQLLSAVVCLAAELPATYARARNLLVDDEWLDDVLALPIADTFPDIHVSPRLADRQLASIAGNLAAIVEPAGLDIYELPASGYPLYHRLRQFGAKRDVVANSADDDMFAAAVVNSTDNSTDSDAKYSQVDVANFQIILWTSIILLVFILVAACAMTSLHWDGQDSGLYIETSHVQKYHLE